MNDDDEKLIFGSDGNVTYDYDEYIDEQDLLVSDPAVKIVAAVTLIMHFMAAIIGVPANIYVLFRMNRLARNDKERYRSGTGIALCTMAAADLCSLLLIIAQNLMQVYTQVDGDTVVMDFVCKFMLFFTHTMTSISIWSWLLLSTLRYLAIRHPLFHLRLWQMPCRALSFIVIVSFTLNWWLLLAVRSTYMGCTQQILFHSLSWNRFFHIIECFWSFCVPCFMIVIMDISVLLKSTSSSWNWGLQLLRRREKYSERAFEPLTRSSFRNITSLVKQQKHSRTLWRWLAIALVCIILNTPENLYRVVVLFGMPDIEEEAFLLSARMLAQALYFSQFAFNAVYLALFVYDKSIKPKTFCEHSIGGNSISICPSCKHLFNLPPMYTTIRVMQSTAPLPR